MEEIDLKAIKQNYQYIRSLTNKEVIGVVKSDGYGFGMIEVCKALQDVNVKMVAVNEIDEAITIKQNQFIFDVLVMNPIEVNDYHKLYAHDGIIYTISSINEALNLNNYCNLKEIRVHLHIDTGMNRFGISSLDEYLQVLGIVLNNEKFKFEGIYSHITSEKNFFNQASSFKKYIKEMVPKYSHLQASSTYSYPLIGNCVRIGLDLYGDGSKKNIKQALKVTCKIIEIRKLKPNQTLGYNENYKSVEEEYIAILPIGYYNGFDRRLTGYSVYIKGSYYKIVGNICMNHIFVKVDDKITNNDVVEVISEHVTLKSMANYLNTVPGEILTRLNIKNKIYKE